MPYCNPVPQRATSNLPVCQSTTGCSSTDCLQDLPRTFPANAWVGSPEGQAALRHVLLAFSVHKPDVGYCQSMNYVAAMLLLCLDLSEERAFWVMVALIDDNGQLDVTLAVSWSDLEMCLLLLSMLSLGYQQLGMLYTHCSFGREPAGDPRLKVAVIGFPV